MLFIFYLVNSSSLDVLFVCLSYLKESTSICSTKSSCFVNNSLDLFFFSFFFLTQPSYWTNRHRIVKMYVALRLKPHGEHLPFQTHRSRLLVFCLAKQWPKKHNSHEILINRIQYLLPCSLTYQHIKNTASSSEFLSSHQKGKMSRNNLDS